MQLVTLNFTFRYSDLKLWYFSQWNDVEESSHATTFYELSYSRIRENLVRGCKKMKWLKQQSGVIAVAVKVNLVYYGK